MSDIVRSAIWAQMTEFPLSWRKDAPDHWSATVNRQLTLTTWPKIDGAWVWEIMKGDDAEESGQGTSRRDAMSKAEAAVRKMLPPPTDVQIVTGWMAHRSEVPDEVLAAGMRLSERDKAERKTKKNDSAQTIDVDRVALVTLVWSGGRWQKEDPRAAGVYADFYGGRKCLSQIAFGLGILPDEADDLVKLHQATDRIQVSEDAAATILRCR